MQLSNIHCNLLEPLFDVPTVPYTILLPILYAITYDGYPLLFIFYFSIPIGFTPIFHSIFQAIHS